MIDWGRRFWPVAGRNAISLILGLAAVACATTPPREVLVATPSGIPIEATRSNAPAANASPSGSLAVGQTEAPGRLAPTGPTEEARVVRVVDGDTIIIDRGRGDERLRYIGMDTPETVKSGSPVEWMGVEASEANRTLVENQTVVIETDVSETDQYRRLLRYVWLHHDGTWHLVNLALVMDGYARVATYPPDVKYVDLYLAAQVDARDHDRGLWGTGPINFVSPVDGATVTTKSIVVTGTAPRGREVVRDVPNALDQRTTAGADGTWSLRVTLKRGINTLKFRLGDDKATMRTLTILSAP